MNLLHEKVDRSYSQSQNLLKATRLTLEVLDLIE